MVTTRFDEFHCSIARTAGVIADPWAILIVRDLFLGLRTYDDLLGDLGIATNVLASRLSTLVDAGVVERRGYRARPPRHDYHLTRAGQDLYGVVLAMMAWGDRYRAADGAPLLLSHDTCGEQSTPRVTCSRCGEALTNETVTVSAGPGGRVARGTAIIGSRLAGKRPTGEAGA